MTFIDTNIFIYVVSGAAADAKKKKIASDLISSVDFGLSVQVLQEFMYVTSRKKSLGLEPEEIREMVNFLARYPIIETSVSLAQNAYEVAQLYQISYWDGAIIAAASELGADILYSEDLNAGQHYKGITVTNPFDE